MLHPVKQSVQVRLLPTSAQAGALLATLQACNAAASWLSEWMHGARVFKKFDVQKQCYAELRERFGLAAQPTIRVISKTVDAYTTLHSNLAAGNYGPPRSKRRRAVESRPIRFRSTAAQPFDARCLSWKIEVAGRASSVSIWSVAGRLRDVRMIGKPAHLKALSSRPVKETDLVHRDGMWLLHVAVDVPEAPGREPVNGFLGVDLES